MDDSPLTEREEVLQEHIDRAKKGKDVWNKWAEGVELLIEEEIKKKNGNNASDGQKLAILSQYRINFTTGQTANEEDNTLDVSQFDGFNFPIEANFANVKFSGIANFDGAKFSYGARFINAKFSGRADFSYATFSGDANFRDATFSGEANFSGKTTFSSWANFSNAEFSGEAYFRDATFYGKANFRGATFSSEAYFARATFSGDADFFNTTFSNLAGFKIAEFYGENTNFDDAKFYGKANFRGAIFNGVHQTISFEGAQFKEANSFADVKFESLKDKVPFTNPVDFRNAYFQATPLVDSFPVIYRNLLKLISIERRVKNRVKKTFIQKANLNFAY